MRLSHYEGLSLPLGKDAPTPETVTELRRKVLESRKLNRGLKVVKARNEVLLKHLRTLLLPPEQQTLSTTTENEAPHSETSPPSLAFLTAPSFAPTTNLKTTAQFTTSQLPTLRDALQRLRPLLRVTPEEAARHAERQGNSSGREERRGYIEGRVRSVVQRERVGGEEEFLPGGGGNTVGEEEVRGLEALVDKMEG